MFSIDPASGVVELGAPAALNALAQGECGGGEPRVLMPGTELELVTYSATFLPGNILEITGTFKNVTDYIFTQPFSFTKADTTSHIVGSSEPTLSAADLGGDDQLSPDESSSVLSFQVEHRGQPFTYEVIAKALVDCEPAPQTATLTIIKNVADGSAPDDFSFNLYGYDPFELLEQFSLDDDGDSANDLSDRKVFSLPANRSYGVSEAGVGANGSVWQLGITCSSSDPERQFPGVSADPNNGGQGIALDTVAPGERISCTFTNVYVVPTYDLRIIKYNDVDQDGTDNELNKGVGDAPSGNALTGWEFTVYDDLGNQVAQGTTSTENPGANGDLGIRVTLPGLVSGETYTVCETQQEGWVNSQPGTLNPTYGEPCETLTLNSTSTVTRFFGNYEEPDLIAMYATKLRDDKVGSVSFVNDERLAGWEFTLYDASSSELARATTGADGVAALGNHPPGIYTWCETPQMGWENTLPGAGADPDPAGQGRPCVTREVLDTVTNSSSNFWNYELVNEAPVITSYGGAKPASDTVLSGATLVENLAATDDTDSEGAGLSWSISGGADGGGAIFGIIPSTGVLVFNFGADFSNPQDANGDNIYEVEVTVTDSGGLTDVLTINIEVVPQP